MVEQAVCCFDGVTQMHIDVKTTDDSVTVNVDAVSISGVHVPTVTLNMQKAIREYMEQNCGIAIRSVDVTVNSVDALPPDAPRPVISAPAPKAIAEMDPAPSAQPDPDTLPDPVIAEELSAEDVEPEVQD